MELKVWMKLEYTYKREQIRNNKCKKIDIRINKEEL